MEAPNPTPANVAFTETSCAICGVNVPAKQMYEANFRLEDITPATFSAHRLPDRIHYRMVRCERCALVRSDPVLDESTLARLYAESTFDYRGETDRLRSTYGRYLTKLREFDGSQEALLEVGCGDGFFLEEALKQGFTHVRGVEPSREAIEKAAPSVRDSIVCDVMRPGLFSAEFDAVCLFQVFDHVSHPGQVLDACHAALRPGGMILCLNHNVESISARLLRERSPIVDIEHTYLYSPATMRRIFRAHGFEVVEQGSVFNTYSLGYLFHLLPLPRGMKNALLRTMNRLFVGRLPISVPLGNLYLIGKRIEK